jgi:branched-chain amino acid transport system substrate-binding protein
METKKYKIGVSAPLSGCEADHGIAMVRSVQLAVDEALGDNPLLSLEVISLDDRGETDGGRQVAEQFVKDPEVLGVVGPMNSNPSLGAASVYNLAGLTHISNAASNVALSKLGDKTFFRMIANDDVQGDALVKFMTKHLKVNKMTIINDGTDFSSGLALLVSEKATEAGIQVIDHLEVACEQEDYRTELSSLDLSTPEVIFFAILEPEGKTISRQLREMGNRSVFLGTDALKPSKFLLVPESDVPGPYHSCATTDIFTKASALEFAQAYQKKFGEMYSIYTAEAYDAARLLINAICKSNEPTRQAVLQAVAGTSNFQGAIGEISFTESGELADPQISFHVFDNDTLKFIGLSDQFE